ncbi:hypothetical protein [Jeotgalicoccus meleagridis]
MVATMLLVAGSVLTFFRRKNKNK